jgi:hypothetical protein
MTKQKLLQNVNDIKQYISKHKKDDCGTWEYFHTPYIEASLTNFGEIESQELKAEIWNWDENYLYEIADPIIFSNNKYLGDDLYIKIFSKVNNTEYLDYLVENVIHYIRPPYYNSDRIKDWNTELIINLNSNVNKLIDIKDDGWKTTLKQVNNFLNDVIETRNKNYS